MAQRSDTPVCLPKLLAEQIIQHAREGKPEEICGILRGRGLTAYEVIRGKNIAEERIENYTVDPQTLLLQFKFEENDEEMMGIYHSHPVSIAYPSATDAWNAYYPDSIYFICSLEHDDAPVIRAFRMITHFLDFDPALLQNELPFAEVRPGLFATYQAPQETVPAMLATLVAAVERPFYLVYQVEAGTASDLRAVTLVEHPLVIED